MAGKLFDVATLKAAIGGGAKADKFSIEFGAPTGNASFALGLNEIILCKSTSFPAMKLGDMDVWMQGRKVLIPGDVSFDNSWSLDFYQTADHALRQKFVNWIASIDDYAKNNHTCTPADWSVSAKVYQLGCDGNVVAGYEMFNMYPNQVGSVSVDGERINTIQEFTVDFTYSHWAPIKL